MDWSEMAPYLLREAPGLINITSGNPLVPDRVASVYRDAFQRAIDNVDMSSTICRYAESGGIHQLLDLLANLYSPVYGRSLTRQNVLITPGSQGAFYYLATRTIGHRRRIVLPVGPEYPGYITHAESHFVQLCPEISLTGDFGFRYRVAPDLEALLPADAGHLILSRPGNPTSNMLPRGDVDRLVQAAEAVGGLLVMDSAYESPLPGIVFVPDPVPWNDHIVRVHSMSKAALAGERLGFVIAHEDLVAELVSVQNRVQIFPPQLAQFMLVQAISTCGLIEVLRTELPRAYGERQTVARSLLESRLSGSPARVHDLGGGPFVWLWCPGIPGGTAALFRDLAEAGVLVTPSSPFYLPDLRSWTHADECIRIGTSVSVAHLSRAVETISAAVLRAYDHSRAL